MFVHSPLLLSSGDAPPRFDTAQRTLLGRAQPVYFLHTKRV